MIDVVLPADAGHLPRRSHAAGVVWARRSDAHDRAAVAAVTVANVERASTEIDSFGSAALILDALQPGGWTSAELEEFYAESLDFDGAWQSEPEQVAGFIEGVRSVVDELGE